MKRWLTLFLFLLLTIGGGWLLGSITETTGWYDSLAKPPFNPPNWLFPPVWTLLYVLIAIAGWRIFERDRHGPAMRLWWTQLALNFLWTPVYFGAHLIGLALVVMALLLIAIIGFIRVARGRDPVAAALFIPYALWVAFAALLNASIWWLN